MVHPTTAILVQPGALLVTAPAATSVEALNREALAPHGLCLPIAPLEPGLTLAELIARNAGGRRRLRYGPIVRYLRAAQLRIADTSLQSAIGNPQSTIQVGGPTLKRATGYGLNRALVSGGRALGLDLRPADLVEVTLSLRPLPAARHAVLLTCAGPDVACQLGASLLAQGLSLAALALLELSDWSLPIDALIDNPQSFGPAQDRSAIRNPQSAIRNLQSPSLLLAELEGAPEVVARQAAAVARAAQASATAVDDPAGDAWRIWEAAAAARRQVGSLALDLTLPRAGLPAFIGQARQIARRYRLELPLWGDVGVGTIHLSLAGHPGEIRQAAALLCHIARRMGGAPATELGDGAAAELWEIDGRQETGRQGDRKTGERDISPSHPLVSRLCAIVGERHVLTRPADLGCYAEDASVARATGAPLAVVLPASTAEVSAVLRLAAAAGAPVVTRGAGSGLAGGCTPSPGALVLALTRMQRLCVDPAQMVAHAEAGVVTADLQRAAEEAGLFYPPDPSSQGISTIGGNIACNAGGPRCLKYGVTADYVLGLTAVLADGSIIQAGDGLAGQSPDASLLQLLIGSEGTLAVITEATLRLVPQPPARRTALAIFDRLDDACAAVETIMAAGLLPAGLELMDDTTIGVVEDYLRLGLPCDAGALLLLLADGEAEAVAAEAEALAERARRAGARSVQVARGAADEAALWRARRAIAPALARVRPNRLGEDICVPLTRIAECVRRIKAIAVEYGQPIAVFGHAGDGNLHPNILFDSRDPAQVARVWQAAEAIFKLALELGGTLSGEHGIGTLKRPFMELALGPAAIALQRAVKDRFDPAGRLNPGKVLP